MLLGPRRMVLIGTIAAIATIIILLPFIFAQTAPDLNQVGVRLSNVSVASVDQRDLQLRVVFTLENPTSQTATPSKIEYELFADGISLGTNTISYEETPINGRPPIFSHGSVDVPGKTMPPFKLQYEDRIADIYNKIKDNSNSVKWKASGTAQIDSTLTQVEKTFENEI